MSVGGIGKGSGMVGVGVVILSRDVKKLPRLTRHPAGGQSDINLPINYEPMESARVSQPGALLELELCRVVWDTCHERCDAHCATRRVWSRRWSKL